MCNTCQNVCKTATTLSRHKTQKHPSSSSEMKNHKLEKSKFDENFKESVDSLAKDEYYPEYIRDQLKTLVMDNMQLNNNLYEDAIVIYEKLI